MAWDGSNVAPHTQPRYIYVYRCVCINCTIQMGREAAVVCLQGTGMEANEDALVQAARRLAMHVVRHFIPPYVTSCYVPSAGYVISVI